MYGTVLAVAVTTGMRPSEFVGLKWQDIDWNGEPSVSKEHCENYLRVNGNMARPNGQEAGESSDCRIGSLEG